MNSRSGKPYQQFKPSEIKRGFWGSTGLHIAVLIVLAVVPIMLWQDQEPKVPPTIEVDFSATTAAEDLLELAGLPTPVPEIEVVPPPDAEAFLVEAGMDEMQGSAAFPERDLARPSPLESWPSSSAWVKDRIAYRGARVPQPQVIPSKPPVVTPTNPPKPAVVDPMDPPSDVAPKDPQPTVDPKSPPPANSTNPAHPTAVADQQDPIPDPQASPRPIYPWQAIRRKLQGVVQVLVEVDSHGKVVSVRVAQTSGHGILDRAALEGVKKWKFTPARKNGKAVPGAALVPIRFHIQRP